MESYRITDIMNKWFTVKDFSLNFDKTGFIKFVTNNKPIAGVLISCHIQKLPNLIPLYRMILNYV
jgi:hypothetical protein